MNKLSKWIGGNFLKRKDSDEFSESEFLQDEIGLGTNHLDVEKGGQQNESKYLLLS